MTPKKKARKVRHVDEVAALEHGPRQCQKHERSITLNGCEIDEVVDKIYARIARVVQGGERKREGCSFGDFCKQNPPTFIGESNPMEAENWVLKMEKLLRALECTDAQKVVYAKVVYATFALQDFAERWWTSIEHLLRMELGEDTPITWEKFKGVFNQTYFPDVVRDREEREFFGLVQGTMIVEEYATKFVELSHFTPYLIPNEPKKVSQFQKGLNDKIHPYIIAYGVGSFTEIVKRAISLEEDFKCKLDSREDEKKQEPSGFQHGEGQGQNFKRGLLKKSSNGGHSYG